MGRYIAVLYLSLVNLTIVIIQPCDSVLALGFVVNRRIGLRTLYCRELCRSPTRESIIPLSVLPVKAGCCWAIVGRHCVIFQLRPVKHRLTVIIQEGNLVFLGGLCELCNVCLVAFHLHKTISTCTLQSPACEVKRIRTVVRFVRIGRCRCDSSQIGAIRRCAIIIHFRRSQYRHIIIKERDCVRTRVTCIVRHISSRTAYCSNCR